jgi:hypothetical protein
MITFATTRTFSSSLVRDKGAPLDRDLATIQCYLTNSNFTQLIRSQYTLRAYLFEGSLTLVRRGLGRGKQHIQKLR